MSLSKIFPEHYSTHKRPNFRQYCVKHKSYDCMPVPSKKEAHQPIHQQVSELHGPFQGQDTAQKENSKHKDSKTTSKKYTETRGASAISA
jgi:hypothetical protein